MNARRLNSASQPLDGPVGGMGRRRVLTQITIVAGAVLGMTMCVTTLLSYSMGVFISTFVNEFGWSRGDVSVASTCYTAVIFLGSALAGRLADTVNPGKLAAVSMAAFGVLLLLTPHLLSDVRSLWLIYLALSIVGLGTVPAVLLKPVVANFSDRRGLALGLSLAGVGLGAAIIPFFASAMVAAGGWRQGYVGLGAAALVSAPILWLALANAGLPRHAGNGPADAVGVAIVGMTFRQAARTRGFWLLSGVALLAGLGMGGPATHMIPFLGDHGRVGADAATVAGLAGVGSIVGRVTGGFSLDRVRGPALGLVFLATGALGVQLLLLDVRAASAGAFLLGFMIGSEVDILAYFVSRYFGLLAHGTIFGWNYGMLALGSSASVLTAGYLRDRHGDYGLTFQLSVGALVIAALLCPLLGRYRYATH